jgi:hypothetical protein
MRISPCHMSACDLVGGDNLIPFSPILTTHVSPSLSFLCSSSLSLFFSFPPYPSRKLSSSSLSLFLFFSFLFSLPFSLLVSHARPSPFLLFFLLSLVLSRTHNPLPISFLPLLSTSHTRTLKERVIERETCRDCEREMLTVMLMKKSRRKRWVSAIDIRRGKIPSFFL